MSTIRSYLYCKASVNAPMLYRYESTYMLIMFIVDTSKQYHFSYIIKQIKLFYDLSKSIDRQNTKNACRIIANKRPRHRNQGLNIYVLSHKPEIQIPVLTKVWLTIHNIGP